jgi:sulfoxide reductase heme-binding subunit YedZ
MTPPSPLWFLDRSAGEVTLVLLTVAMVLGIVRAGMPAFRPFLVEGAHVNISLLVLLFAALHLLAAILDPFTKLGLADMLVPFVSAYRGVWMGLGVVSAYLYVATILLSWPARRLPRATWLWVHRTMYGAWVLALLHSLGTGSDVRNAVFLLLNLLVVGVTLVAFLAIRVAEGYGSRPRWSALLAAAGVLLVLGIGVWAAAGPLQPGWARSSGTPVNLLRSP